VGGGRGKHGKENPRRFYAVGLRTEPAPIVRGSSRRITIMRFRPANIRVINRRDSLSTATRAAFKKRGNADANWMGNLTGRSISVACLG
jgi:hypothetical protein